MAVIQNLPDKLKSEKVPFEDMIPKEIAEDFEQMMSYFIDIKNELYPNDLRIVQNYEVIEAGGDIRLNVASSPFRDKTLHESIAEF